MNYAFAVMRTVQHAGQLFFVQSRAGGTLNDGTQRMRSRKGRPRAFCNLCRLESSRCKRSDRNHGGPNNPWKPWKQQHKDYTK